MQAYSSSPREMVTSVWRHRGLVLALAWREVIGRYRGSVMGLAWSFFNPLFMLAIYTFVFSSILNARWGAGDEGKVGFAIMLFVGMIVHGLFSECAQRAPGLILSNVNFVKKVVFPLEVLPWVVLVSSLFHAAVSAMALLAAQLLLRHHMPWTVVLFPLVLVPLALTTMGFSWFLASLGMYLRDIGQMVALACTALMFVSPVFYPVTAVPAGFRRIMEWNPLTYVIEQGRNTLVHGRVPDLLPWVVACGVGLVVAWAGFAWFQKTRKGFADVV